MSTLSDPAPTSYPSYAEAVQFYEKRQWKHPAWSSSASLSSKSVSSVSKMSLASLSSATATGSSGSSITGIPTWSSGSSTSALQQSTTGFPLPLTTSTTVPLTLTLASSTILTSTVSLVELSSSPTVAPVMDPPAYVSGNVCAGGLDSSAQGVLATTIITALIGLLIWLAFAIVRPRFPHLYALREWFPNPDIRPPHLRSGLLAFLHPPVPLVPDLPADTSDAGRSATDDAQLFPSDQELTQRTLWTAFFIALGWTLLGLIAALPLYVASTPCWAESSPQIPYGGALNTLTDLSLLRLIKLMDNTRVSDPSLSRRAIVGDSDKKPNTRIRLIILTVLVLLLGVLPAMFKLIREFNAVVAYRKRWLEVHCANIEMGWLSLKDAPGFTGWGEGRIKDFLIKNGLSSGMNRARSPRTGRITDSNGQVAEGGNEDNGRPDVDVHGLFTIPETGRLAELIEERDHVLEDLEVAEARYIASFRLTSGVPGQEEVDLDDDERDRSMRIPRPKLLSGTHQRRNSRQVAGVDEGTPTSYVAPSSYYKLREVHDAEKADAPDPHGVKRPKAGEPLTESFGRSVVGTKFQEVHHDEIKHGALSLGTAVRMGKSGRIGLGLSSASERDVPPHGPNSIPDEHGELRKSTISGEGNEERVPWPTETTQRPRQHQTPLVRPLTGQHETLGQIYHTISNARTRIKALNNEISDVQQEKFNDIAAGRAVKGWLLFGNGIRHIPKIKMIEGRSKEDVRWDELQGNRIGLVNTLIYWLSVVVVGLLLAAALAAVAGLAVAGAPNYAHFAGFLKGASSSDNFGAGIATTLAPTVAATLFIAAAVYLIHYMSKIGGYVSVSSMLLSEFKSIFYILTFVCGMWLTAAGALLFSVGSFAAADTNEPRSRTVADGSIYIAVLLMVIIISLAIISPGLLLLRPVRLWKTWTAYRKAVTPRQRFRALYPSRYNPSFALACSVLAVVFASMFAIIFPLIGPPIVLLLILTLVAHRFLVGYVYGRTGVGQTGGLLQLWILRRLGTLLALQPFVLGIILLSRELWGLAGILLGAAFLIVVFMEAYTWYRMRLPGRNSLSPIARDSLENLARATSLRSRSPSKEEGLSLVSSRLTHSRRPRSSMASILDMMSLTLAVMPSTSRTRGPVPLNTEAIDDRVSTEKAARTRPGAPPYLSFADRAEDTAGLLYPPPLLAPLPIIWLPNDSDGANVAHSEAFDLQKYHGLEVTLEAVHERRRSYSTHRSASRQQEARSGSPAASHNA
ncbi:hypothetical protein FRC03_007124 [Tulasnella sp. 419]|nr:hypothetical protein FRC03_007124 [Tulasnella sp. 419]